MSQSEYVAYLARHHPIISQNLAQAIEHESDLHDSILDYCRKRGWLVIHSRMDIRSTTARGVPDFVVLADCGRTFYIECKSRNGKLTPEQQAWGAAALRNGHIVYIIRSMNEFVTLTK